MKMARVILLIIVAVLLSGSVILAQLAYRIETSLLSYRYTSEILKSIIEPLDDPEIHRTTVRGAFRFLRRELSIQVPSQLEPHIISASVEGFSREWFQRTADRMLYSTQLVLNGREKSLSFPLSLGNFKSAFINSVRADFDTDEYLKIEREIGRIPSSIEITDEIPEESLNRTIGILGNTRFVLILLQYVAPAVFILLCFVFRRIGSAFTAVGAGLLVGGTSIAVLATGFYDTLAAMASRSLRGAVPEFLSWLDAGVNYLMQDFLKKLAPLAFVVSICGLVFVGIGVLLVVYKHDPEIRWGGEHS